MLSRGPFDSRLRIQHLPARARKPGSKRPTSLDPELHRMAAGFDQWEKDPFFPAAEEVQDSADRMESVYRLWIQEGANAPSELRRDLQTALGTAKWQLEDLERAISAYDEVCSAGDDTKARHTQFISAIGSRILEVENSLGEFNPEDGKREPAWVRLDAGEQDELALFLSGATREQENLSVSPNKPGSPETEEEMVQDQQRMVRAGADTGEWKISIPSEDSMGRSSDGLTSDVELASKFSWFRSGFRKWKGRHRHDAAESTPLLNHEFSQDVNACLERSKSRINECDEDCDCYDKKLYGWLGALHRQLQRSQYQIQYGQPIQLIVWAVLVILLIVFFATRAI